MIQSLVRRAMSAVGPPLAHGSCWSFTVKDQEVQGEVLDLRGAPASERERAHCVLMESQRATLEAATHGRTDDDVEERLQRFVDSCVSDEACALFNRVIVLSVAGNVVATIQGYATLRTIGDRTYEVLRARVNVQSSARGLGLTSRGGYVMLRAYLAERALTPHPRIYVGICMSPVSFWYAQRRCRHCLPGPGEPPAAYQELYQELFETQPGEVAILPHAVGSAPSPRTQAFLKANSTDPFIRFYLKWNPDYAKGYVMPLMIPLQGVNFAETLVRVLVLEARRGLRPHRRL